MEKNTSSIMIDAKLPPNNPDAEDAVLGSLLINGDMIDSINLEVKDFYFENNQLIYKSMLNLKKKNVAIDIITVAQELKDNGLIESMGNNGHLNYLVSIVPTSLDCPYYADIVKNLSTNRNMILAGDRISSIGYDDEGDIEDKLNRADNIILKLRATSGTKHIISPKERTDNLYDRYSELYQSENVMALSTGLIDLDKVLGGGFYPSELIILAARTSMGKTSFLETISNYIGLTQNVLFCSGEMDIESLSDRDVASMVGVPVDKLRRGKYDDELYSNIVAVLPRINELKVYHMDATQKFQLSTENIYQAAYDTQLRYGLSMVVVDYLGLIIDREGSNQNERLGHISRKLKTMARSLNIPILCAHQLSRDIERRENKRPMLHDLRESGHIEEDADVVIFLYRDSYYDDDAGDIMEVLIGKKRQGGGGKGIKILWDKKHQTYRNLEKNS